MKTKIIIVAMLIILLELVGTAYAQGEGEAVATTDSPNPLKCFIFLGIMAVVLVIFAGLVGHTKDKARPEGIVYINTGTRYSTTTRIKRIDDASREHDNRKETGYW